MSEPLRLVSLSILGGPLHGRRHNPEEVVAEILIGSDPDCHLVVELPGISPIHAKLWADLNESTVYDTSAPRGVYVNTTRVEDKAPVGEGDVLWLGPPQEPDSVCVKLHFEPWVEVLPGVSAPSAHAGEDAVVVDSDAASTQAVTPEMIPSEAPAEPEPDAEVVEDVVAAPAEPASEGPAETPTVVEPSAQAASDEDPFFVGDEPAAPSAAPAAEEAVPAAGDWAIPEAAVAEESQPAPAPAADEFFVAGEPEEPAAQEPTFIEAEPVLEASVVEPPPPAVAVPFLDLPPLEPPAPPPPAPVPPPPPPPAPAKAAAPAPKRPPAPPVPAEPEPEPEPPPPAAEAEAPRATETPAAKPAAAPRPQPAAPRRPAGAAPAAKAAPARRAPAGTRPATRAAGGPAAWVRPVAFGAAGALLLGVLAFGALKLFGASLRLDAVEPTRLRVGQRATLTGSGFGTEPKALTVVFGDREARVLQASPKRLEVEVPESVVAAGAEGRVSVVVRASGRTSGVVDVAVFQGPRLHGISPGAAMPGEEVMLAGAGWGIGATVQFGSVPAQILEVQPTQIRALVPELPGGPGTEAPVVVSVGGVESNHAPFILGHLPVLSGLNPKTGRTRRRRERVRPRLRHDRPAQRRARGRGARAGDRVEQRLAADDRAAAGRGRGHARGRAARAGLDERRPGAAAAQAARRPGRLPLHRRAVRARPRADARPARDRVRPGLRPGERRAA